MSLGASTDLWIYQDDKDHRNAFYVPGHGWYGGLPAELAKQIVFEHNQQQMANTATTRDGGPHAKT